MPRFAPRRDGRRRDEQRRHAANRIGFHRLEALQVGLDRQQQVGSQRRVIEEGGQGDHGARTLEGVSQSWHRIERVGLRDDQYAPVARGCQPVRQSGRRYRCRRVTRHPLLEPEVHTGEDAALSAQRAQQQVEGERGPARGDAVLALERRASDHRQRSAGAGEFGGEAVDPVGVDAATLGGRRQIGRRLRVERFVSLSCRLRDRTGTQQQPGQPAREHALGSRPYRQPVVRVGGSQRVARLDLNQLPAPVGRQFGPDGAEVDRTAPAVEEGRSDAENVVCARHVIGRPPGLTEREPGGLPFDHRFGRLPMNRRRRTDGGSEPTLQAQQRA